MSAPRTCMELGVCQNRPGCPVCKTPHHAPAPIAVEGPFTPARGPWLRRALRIAGLAMLASGVLALVAGLVTGRLA